MSLTIWCNAKFNETVTQRLVAAIRDRGHQLVWASNASASVLDAGGPDAAMNEADIAFGQPDVSQSRDSAKLRWVEVTTAGYARYDTPDFKETLGARGALFTNMSGVFAEPCAQHLLAQMLALARQLPASWNDQHQDSPPWNYTDRRAQSTLLNGQTVLLLSYGSIARRLVELLQPFGMKIYALRRRTYSEAGVHVIAEEKLSAVLPEVDHLVNILPESEATTGFVNARRLALLKRGARFYNIGRGPTVDQNALMEALESGHLDSAYLDVMDPEPLPPEHRLWRTKNCHITPHTGGGRSDQDDAIVTHFLDNLAAFEADRADDMANRIV
ncbi:D-2-hydroxyacid dehydrogenase [Synoicihabitans lomoniglobus]|uniref:D-2-hydroxyacid dehydrogenase n=1 Tax=Synoicihabitans lomoniglobus TaxID=2909285 RepID=A0AAE9ZW66_9BACT|nr:D-2-hydroxyacid dehydrogenase [Opitutaceae bacterium LMO-M01]WED64299.1 D-2-hydroxyacid dehydrogenase [Opitutaceae bacterium LMO-M01]